MSDNEMNNINQIDMECYLADDDDLDIRSDEIEAIDDRNIQSKTGIIIDLSDDTDSIPSRNIVPTTSIINDAVDIYSDFDHKSSYGYNEIDMETRYSEDDDTDNINLDDNKGLVCAEMLDEDKRNISAGTVEADYWKKITAKHRKSNKKGAYNTHFHLCGNPEKETKIFNHMMGAYELAADIGNSGELGNSDAASSASESASICESCTSIDYKNKLFELFEALGFEIFENSDGSYVVIDTCDLLPEIKSDTLAEVIVILKPYIDDAVVTALQVATNKNFSDYKDWLDWYSDDMRIMYPKCADEIEYCNIIANHLYE